MKMDRSGIGFALVLIVIVIGSTTWAASPENDAGAYEAPRLARLVMDNIGRLLLLRSELDITDNQKQKLRAIVNQHRKEIAPVATAVVNQRKALREVVMNKPNDQDAIRSAAAELGKAIGDASIVRARVASEMKQVLTQHQQGKVRKFRANLDKSTAAWLEEFGK